MVGLWRHAFVTFMIAAFSVGSSAYAIFYDEAYVPTPSGKPAAYVIGNYRRNTDDYYHSIRHTAYAYASLGGGTVWYVIAGYNDTPLVYGHLVYLVEGSLSASQSFTYEPDTFNRHLVYAYTFVYVSASDAANATIGPPGF
jgi:hypothetical protein